MRIFKGTINVTDKISARKMEDRLMNIYEIEFANINIKTQKIMVSYEAVNINNILNKMNKEIKKINANAEIRPL